MFMFSHTLRYLGPTSLIHPDGSYRMIKALLDQYFAGRGGYVQKKVLIYQDFATTFSTFFSTHLFSYLTKPVNNKFTS